MIKWLATDGSLPGSISYYSSDANLEDGKPAFVIYEQFDGYRLFLKYEKNVNNFLFKRLEAAKSFAEIEWRMLCGGSKIIKRRGL